MKSYKTQHGAFFCENFRPFEFILVKLRYYVDLKFNENSTKFLKKAFCRSSIAF